MGMVGPVGLVRPGRFCSHIVMPFSARGSLHTAAGRVRAKFGNIWCRKLEKLALNLCRRASLSAYKMVTARFDNKPHIAWLNADVIDAFRLREFLPAFGNSIPVRSRQTNC